MRRNVWVAGVMALAFGFSAVSAQADSVSYLTGGGGLAESHTFDLGGGLEMTATATAYDADAHQTHDAWVGQYSYGLGVTNSRRDSSHTVDGSGWDDTLWLSFNQTVTLAGVKFAYVGYGEDVKIVDEFGAELGDFDLNPYYGGFAWLDLSSYNFSGTKFGLTADGKCDSWKVKAIKTTPVPTPAALGGGLMLLLGMGLKRRRAAA